MSSENIKQLMESDPNLLKSDVSAVSNLIGIPEKYIHHIKEKERNVLEQKKVLKSFKESPLSVLCCVVEEMFSSASPLWKEI